MANLTRKALYDAFFKLLSERPYKKITVSDVTQECGINRMTFYYHFKDLNNLVERAFEDNFSKILRSSQNKGDWAECYLQIFLMVQEKKEFVKKLYPEFDIKKFVSFLFPLAFQLSNEAISERVGDRLSEKTKNRLVHPIACCMVGTFLEWLEKDMQDDPHELVKEQKEVFDAAVIGILHYMNIHNQK
jgi:AcrR family transcriptional regulator